MCELLVECFKNVVYPARIVASCIPGVPIMKSMHFDPRVYHTLGNDLCMGAMYTSAINL
jgi:hypothetical protein